MGRNTCAHLLILILVGVCIYSNTLHVPFIFDDEAYIVKNPAIRDFSFFSDPLRALGLSFLAPNFRDAFLTRITGSFTFALNYAYSGLDVTSYHLFNLLVHLANALLVYALVRLTLHTPFFGLQPASGSLPPAEGSVLPAGMHSSLSGFVPLFTALLFVCHPVQTQAVTYLSQRFASLATLFYILSLVCYVRFRLAGPARGRALFYTASVVSAVLAMTTKEISFTLPFLIALYDAMFFRGELRKRILVLVPLFLTMLIIPLTLLKLSAVKGAGGIATAMNSLASGPLMSRGDYLVTQFRVIVTYLRLFFFPVGQTLDYDYPIYHSITALPVLASFLFLSALFALALYLLYTSSFKVQVLSFKQPDTSNLKPKTSNIKPALLRLIAFGIFWFFITISIESSIIPIADVIFEHRVYLPSVGFFIALVAFVAWMAERFGERMPSLKRGIVPALALVVALLSVSAYARNGVWRDEKTLWQDVKEKGPLKPRSYNRLGMIYYSQRRYVEAEREYREAIRLYPDYDDAHCNLGNVYAAEGRYAQALEEYRTAVRLNPALIEARYDIGQISVREGRYGEAAEAFQEVIKQNPDHVGAHFNLGATYAGLGRPREAAGEYRLILQLNPNDLAARNALQEIERLAGESRTVIGQPDRTGHYQPDRVR